MSCNGCRVLRKGCNENCILRQSLQNIDSPHAQANATVFVAKFFGRAGLMSFLSAVPESQRPALFQSLLFEACGRTVNPVTGAVGLLWTGKWHVCQSAVETVLRGGVLREMPELIAVGDPPPESDEVSESNNVDLFGSSRDLHSRRSKACKRKGSDDMARQEPINDLELQLSFPVSRRRETTPSTNSEESATTTFESRSSYDYPNLQRQSESKLLRLFL